jgi:hypothetical protein
MFRVLALALAVFSVATSHPARQYGWSDMVQPLAWTTQTAEMDEDEGIILGPPKVKNHCTAWTYRTPGDPETLHWITAAHCVADENTHEYDAEDYQIQGEPVYVETWDVIHDVASLIDYSEAHSGIPSQHISTQNPTVATDPQAPNLTIRGYPLGYSQLFTTFGYVSVVGRHDETDPDGVVYNVFQVPIAAGSSGSPVYDRNDRVVGLLQIGWGRGFSSMSGGLSLTALRTFLQDLP